MSHVTLFLPPCHMSLSPMSHVEFKKWSCRCVDFRGLGPSQGLAGTITCPIVHWQAFLFYYTLCLFADLAVEEADLMLREAGRMYVEAGLVTEACRLFYLSMERRGLQHRHVVAAFCARAFCSG